LNLKTIVLIIAVSALFPACSRAENRFINPLFTFTESGLDVTLTPLPDEIQKTIKSDRKDFLDKVFPLINVYGNFLDLADKNHPLSENYIPDDLVDLDSYNIVVNKKGMQLRMPAFNALTEMLKEAENQSLKIMVSSAYRSYAYQERIYNYYVSLYGQTETDKFSAKPGTSQHQLGTALDFGSISEEFADTDEGKWLFINSFKYGFSLSYPEGYEEITGYNYEPWHYRYITPEGCILQKEYFNDIQQYMLEYLDANINLLKEKSVNEN
jgi:D-alanyl-D-alanine carboxypeptidase